MGVGVGGWGERERERKKVSETTTHAWQLSLTGDTLFTDAPCSHDTKREREKPSKHYISLSTSLQHCYMVDENQNTFKCNTSQMDKFVLITQRPDGQVRTDNSKARWTSSY